MIRALHFLSSRINRDADHERDHQRRQGGSTLLAVTSVVSRLFNTIRLLDRPSHLLRIARSRRIVAKLASLRGEGAAGRAFAYLRTVDPHVFEEVVLTGFENAGYFVLRNRRYTGDGGIDGRIVVPGTLGRTLAVQTKRYKSAVNPVHMDHFGRAIRAGGHAGGVFVHCGRTGPFTKRNVRGSNVDIISGSALLNLLLRGQVNELTAQRHAS